jgi:hypothetical protein
MWYVVTFIVIVLLWVSKTQKFQFFQSSKISIGSVLLRRNEVKRQTDPQGTKGNKVTVKTTTDNPEVFFKKSALKSFFCNKIGLFPKC